jgi:hypothetical protein
MTSSRQNRISSLPAHLQEQLRRRLAGRAEPTRTIPAADRSAPLPLSFSQQRLWFLDELAPGGAAYNSALVRRLLGRIDVPPRRRAAGGSWRGTRRCAPPSTPSTAEPVQVVHPAGTSTTVVVDLSAPPGPGPGEAVGVLDAEYSRPFDLREGPLFRSLLVRLADDEHVLLLTAHHVVTDGWSMDVLLEELSTLYRAAWPVRRSTGRTCCRHPRCSTRTSRPGSVTGRPDRARAPGSTGGPATWPGLDPLQLPTDRPRPAMRTTSGAVHEAVVPAGTAAALGALARAQETTLFTALVAACQVLLAAHAGQDDVAVGTAVSGRNRSELNRAVGFFVNTIVLRSTVDRAATFREFLAAVTTTVLDAFDHDEVPFDQLVDALQTERDPSRNPLFDVMVVLQNSRRRNPEFPGLRTEDVALPRRAANFDLTWEFQERDGDGGLALAVEYNTDLFDAATIERMTGHLLVLVESVVADPDRPLAELAWMPGAERRQVLEEWNATARELPAGTVAALLADRVRRTPDAVAVVAEDAGRVTELTFAELDARANRLAHQLVELGVRPEDRVGLLAERSLGLVVATVAVVKAGGAYLPLDLRAPAERMRALLAGAGASVLLTDDRWARTAGRIHAGPVVRLTPGSPGEGPVDPPAVALHPTTWSTSSTPPARPAPPRGWRCGTATWWRWRPSGGSAPGRTRGCCCTPRSRSTPRPTSSGCPCSAAAGSWWPRRGTSTCTCCAPRSSATRSPGCS